MLLGIVQGKDLKSTTLNLFSLSKVILHLYKGEQV